MGDLSGPNVLWQGELESWMDEHFIGQIWASLGYPVTVRLIRDKVTGESQKYCFLQFPSPELARQCLENFNGTPIPGVPGGSKFRLNSANGLSKAPGEVEYALFVGDLGREVNDHMLYSVFKDKYTSVKNAKVVMDPLTGNSKGYGFVRFSDEYDYQRSLSEMQGYHVGSRAIRVSMGNQSSKTPTGTQSTTNTVAAAIAIPDPLNSEYSNTNIYITGLPLSVSEQELIPHFVDYGHLNSVKVLPGKGVAFVNFSVPDAAAEAFRKTQGMVVNGVIPKISWAKATDKKNTGLIPSFATYQPVISPYAMPAYPAYAMPTYPAYPVAPIEPISTSVVSPIQVIPPKFARPPTPPPDPLEPISVMDENTRYLAQHQNVQINAIMSLYALPPSQTYPLPSPLLY